MAIAVQAIPLCSFVFSNSITFPLLSGVFIPLCSAEASLFAPNSAGNEVLDACPRSSFNQGQLLQNICHADGRNDCILIFESSQYLLFGIGVWNPVRFDAGWKTRLRAFTSQYRYRKPSIVLESLQNGRSKISAGLKSISCIPCRLFINAPQPQ